MFVEVNGCQIFFDVVGSKLKANGPVMQEKPTLLLLHGGPGLDHSGFRPAFDCLEDVAQVVMPDHRGNGRSFSGDSKNWNLDQWADDVKGFCDALGIENPIVFGHSFGAMVAMKYASKYPDHADKLILAATFAKFELDAFVKRFADIGGEQARVAAQDFWTQPTPENTEAWTVHGLPHYSRAPLDLEEMQRMQMSPEVMVHFISGEVHEFDLLPLLADVRSPTLLLAGSEDPVSSVSDMKTIRDALTQTTTQYECIDNASHFLWRDAPDVFFGIVRKFVQKDGRT